MPRPLTETPLPSQLARAVVIGACMVGVVRAAPTLPGAGDAPSALEGDPLFQRLDGNRDRRISRSEASRLPEFLAPFDAADENRDGSLTAEEFRRARMIQERIRSARSLSDGIITARVRSRLNRQQDLPATAIQVETRDGRVSLTGSVARSEQRLQAERLAASVAGVTAVRNAIEVRPIPAPVPAGAGGLTSP